MKPPLGIIFVCSLLLALTGCEDVALKTLLESLLAGETTTETAGSVTVQKIAFHSDRDGDLEIYVMNSDGSGQTRLTNNPASNDAEPDWVEITE